MGELAPPLPITIGIQCRRLLIPIAIGTRVLPIAIGSEVKINYAKAKLCHAATRHQTKIAFVYAMLSLVRGGATFAVMRTCFFVRLFS
ncbi:hypothetical protein CNR22_09045 [Sphingobacteriaceae bacterium]|nr:hypothetical protein CNR22_09045 [Sphingobacteriaceae bacterium]